MNLRPCPLCGESKGYILRDGDTFSEWVVACADCGERVSDCDSDRRPHIGSILPDSWPAADETWNAAAAHAQGLRERIKALEAQRVPLTDEQIADAVREADLDWHHGWTLDETEPNRFTQLVRAVERAHGIEGGETHNARLSGRQQP